MAESLATEILATLGILVTRREGFDTFRIEGQLPLWYLRMEGTDSKAGDELKIGEHFSFLESFLPTALNFWGANKPGRIKSGYWVETNAGSVLPLKASAAVVENEQFLLIEYVKTAYDQGKGHLQKARDNVLQFEKDSASAQKREASLLRAVGGAVLLLREDGHVLESHGTVAAEAIAPAVEAGRKALKSGEMQAFPGGRASPHSDTTFWAVFG